ncbi:ABC transporter substrate-binding protein [Rhizobium sp. 2MFCol3.1]|uniref:ABC transporter substrate-binding protein n=1 Tax=Rhizobium sp. 2MFCol3.1 TaxID=1246459 RepID=UPI0003609B48|nr:ABC transporter substrate-binding protein [Rhizobium sp. 2MFCol3.1]
MKKLILTAAISLVAAGSSLAADLRIGLQDDVDILDPMRSRTFVGKIISTSMCDTLIDVNEKLEYVPRLATKWDWSDGEKMLTMTLRPNVKFQDGTDFNAAAVKANIERSLTAEGSLRRSELASIASVDAPDATTVVFHLKAPDSTLLSQMTSQGGIMLSPTAFAKADFAKAPVCSGPFKFAERVQNDRVVLEKFADYWDKDNYHFDRVIFQPIPDATVRLANLRSGGFDIIERVAPTDFEEVKNDPKVKLVSTPGLGYQAIQINVAHGAGAKDSPLAKDKRLRQAFNLAIDRDVINEVVGAGALTPAVQPFAPASFAYDAKFDFKRDVEKAKALIKAAGYDRVPVELTYGNNTTSQQVFELIQAMTGEAGFDVTLRASEFAAMQAAMKEGNFQAGQGGWAGRVDPDGNISQYVMCKAGLNDSGICNPEIDRTLQAARQTNDLVKRKQFYDEFQQVMQDEVPSVFLYYQPWSYGINAKLTGFKAYPDGMIRLAGVQKAN